ncbi:MAG: MFS transporter [Actinomycetota bacterium]|nr:MFS transporter [Sporichthyaceae bacterium]MDQ3114960.1 MFS transporter [Actinomycetota bacterium]
MTAIPPTTSLWRGDSSRLVIGIFATVFLVAFEAMAVAAAMPIAAAELDGLGLYAWSFTGFLVASLVAMVAAGEVADRVGPRRPLFGGVAIFISGLVLAGVAQSMVPFVLARAVQGIGGGFIIVALYLVVARAFPDEVRPRVFGIMAAGWVLPSVVGPTVAGYLAENVSWRWVFLGLAPLVVPTTALMLGRLRALDGPSAGDHDAESARVRGPRRVGFAVVAAVGVALVQVAGQDLAWTSVAVAAAGLGMLVPSLRPLLPAGALRLRRGLPTSVVMRGLLAASFFGAETFIPLMLVEHRGLPATYSGLSLTSGALGWAAGSWVQSRPGLRLPRHRLIQLGATLVTAGIAVVAVILVGDFPVWLVAVGWVAAGMGMGMSMASTSVLVMQQSPTADQGANAAALQISDSTLSVLFIGLGGTVLAAGGGEDAGSVTFLIIFVVMAAVGVVAALVAPRVRERTGAAAPMMPAPVP